jgi:hypothetical protein
MVLLKMVVNVGYGNAGSNLGVSVAGDGGNNGGDDDSYGD